MDKFSYNSYPDSTESSPRCREIDFENPSPWEDQQQQQQTQATYKVKFMCSYGGKIQPRPHDNQLTYVNGETKILSVDRGIRFQALVSKLSAVIGGGDGGGGGEISFKYQLPGEDLDALISVTNDDDLEHMMHEYDRLLRLSTKPARMRLFLFPPSSSVSVGFGSEGSIKSDRDLGTPISNRADSVKSVTAPSSNADFLFGSEKLPPTPQSPSAVNVLPQQIPVPMVQPEHVVDPADIQRQIQEFQRIQIRDQEQQIQQQQQQHMELQHQQQLQQQQQQHMELQHQQQLQQQEEAMYRRKSEDGRYFSPAPTTVSQTNPQPPIGYWQGNNSNVPGNVYTTTSLNPQEQQQVYMIQAQAQAQAQAPLYHSVMRPPVQGNQGYYPPVQQYMEQQNQNQTQQGYNVVQQPQGGYAGGPQVMTGGAPMGSQMGNHVYYTVGGDGMMVQPQQPQPVQQQYQGMGQPVSGMTDLRTGPDGKVAVNNNMSPKVSDSV